MKYYIVTNRQILTDTGVERIDTTNDGLCTDNLRFATLDSDADPMAYELIPDKIDDGTGSYYFNGDGSEPAGSEKFFTDLATDMNGADGGDLLVFIHGFNVDWASGISTLGEIKQRLVDQPGSPIKHLLLFSWPSCGSVLKYKSDFQDATTAGTTLGRCFQLFTEFLMTAVNTNQTQLTQCGSNIHLLCHSMGNHVLQYMVTKLLVDGNKYHDPFEEVILAAADVDNNIFESPNAFSYLNNLCRRIHVYCNRNDLALKISSKFENPMKRLGSDGPANLNTLPSHVYVIDCTDVACKYDPGIVNKIVEHSYFAEVPEVGADIYSVLLGRNDENIANRVQINDVKYRLVP